MGKSSKRLPPSSAKKKLKSGTNINFLKYGMVVVLAAAVAGYFRFFSVSPEIRALKRSVAPLNFPKVTDLEHFQGKYWDEMLWGTYRPGLYLGIRAR